MKQTALVIMAAGIGSRFGGGIKQLEPVGPSGEIIMDYSIHDALEAGFDRIIFVIRHDLEKDFKEVIGNRIEKIAPVSYAYQELSDLPEGFAVPEGRKKPWGTGQAILSIRDLIVEPFLVINADDYYGKEAVSYTHLDVYKRQLHWFKAIIAISIKNVKGFDYFLLMLRRFPIPFYIWILPYYVESLLLCIFVCYSRCAFLAK